MKTKRILWGAVLPISVLCAVITVKPLFRKGEAWETTAALVVALLLVVFCPKRFEQHFFVVLTLAITATNLSEIITSDDLSVGREIWLWCSVAFFGLFGALALLGFVMERREKEKTG